MRKIPTPLYDKSWEEVERRAEAMAAEAALLPNGVKKQSLLAEAAKFRAYANVKRWSAQKPVERRKRIDL